MTKKLLFALFCLTVSISFGCSSETAPNANSVNGANSTITNIDPKNMPPGLSGNVITPSGNSTPGIPNPQNANVAKGTTPTPGIPANPGKPLPKGATPTPGIPDPANINRQMNSSSTGTSSNQPVSDGDLRERTVRKP